MGLGTKIVLGLSMATAAAAAAVAATLWERRKTHKWYEEASASLARSNDRAREAMEKADGLRMQVYKVEAELEGAWLASEEENMRREVENARAEAEAFKEELLRTQQLLDEAQAKKPKPKRKSPRAKKKAEE